MYDAAGGRAQTWLKHHGFADTDLPLMLAQRLYARYEAHKYLGTATVGGALAAAVILQAGSGAVRLVGLAALIAVVLAARWLARRRRRDIERDVAAELPRRVAHTVPLSAREVIGSSFAIAAALLYLGPLLLLLVTDGRGQSPAAVTGAVGVIGVLAALDIIEVVAIVRRPALAVDAQSLAIDDALRREDARTTVVASLPTVVAWTALGPDLAVSGPVLTVLALAALLIILSLSTEYTRPSRRAVPVA